MEQSELVVGRDYWLCRNPPNKPIVRRCIGYMEATENTRGCPLFSKVRSDGSLGVQEMSDIKHVIGPVEK